MFDSKVELAYMGYFYEIEEPFFICPPRDPGSQAFGAVEQVRDNEEKRLGLFESGLHNLNSTNYKNCFGFIRKAYSVEHLEAVIFNTSWREIGMHLEYFYLGHDYYDMTKVLLKRVDLHELRLICQHHRRSENYTDAHLKPQYLKFKQLLKTRFNKLLTRVNEAIYHLRKTCHQIKFKTNRPCTVTLRRSNKWKDIKALALVLTHEMLPKISTMNSNLYLQEFIKSTLKE